MCSPLDNCAKVHDARLAPHTRLMTGKLAARYGSGAHGTMPQTQRGAIARSRLLLHSQSRSARSRTRHLRHHRSSFSYSTVGESENAHVGHDRPVNNAHDDNNDTAHEPDHTTHSRVNDNNNRSNATRFSSVGDRRRHRHPSFATQEKRSNERRRHVTSEAKGPTAPQAHVACYAREAKQ